MWAGIKHALNGTLGTSDFKSLDKIVNDDFNTVKNTIDTTNNNLEEMDRLIRLDTYECFHRLAYLNSIILPSGFVLVESPSEKDVSYKDFSETNQTAYNITNLVQSPRTTLIPEDCFKDLTGLRNIFISERVKTIQGYIIKTCSYLTYIKLPKYIEYIDSMAFYGSRADMIIDCGFSYSKALELGLERSFAGSYYHGWGKTIYPDQIFFDVD